MFRPSGKNSQRTATGGIGPDPSTSITVSVYLKATTTFKYFAVLARFNESNSLTLTVRQRIQHERIRPERIWKSIFAHVKKNFSFMDTVIIIRGEAWSSEGWGMVQWGVRHGPVRGEAWSSEGWGMVQWGVRHGPVRGEAWSSLGVRHGPVRGEAWSSLGVRHGPVRGEAWSSGQSAWLL